MPFNKQYFIAKFSAIPDELWTVGHFTDDVDPQKHCVLGHCDPEAGDINHRVNDEYAALQGFVASRPFGVSYGWPGINDGECPLFQQETPKARVLAALNALSD